MATKRILVTGAGGLVGDRLVHRIALGSDNDIRALVHRVAGAHVMRLARLPIDIQQGSVLDRSRMAEVIGDCDAVVHLAVGNEAATVDGTKAMLSVAEQAGVDTFVHMSSAAIHGHDLDRTIDESTMIDPDTEYGRWKVRAEEAVEMCRDRGDLQPSIIRPFIVYGPFSEFVTDPIEEIRTGAVLTDGGYGTLNQIHVDNLIDVILLALKHPDAAGETFAAVDDEVISWRRYYRELAMALGEHPPIEDRSWNRLRLEKSIRFATDNVVPPAAAVKHVLMSDELHSHIGRELQRTPWARAGFSHLPTRLQDAVRDALFGGRSSIVPGVRAETDGGAEPTSRPVLPSRRFMEMQTATGKMSNNKVKDVLGWEERVPFEEGMELTRDWLAHAGIS